MRLTQTFIYNGKGKDDDSLSKSDILSINRDLENIFTALQDLNSRPRTVTANPQHATPASRPKSNYVGEVVYYSSNLYFNTNVTTPTWKLITST